MIQLVLLLKRKKGLTKEQFRHHYETSHAPLAMKHLGHLYLHYRRNYTFGRLEYAGTAAPEAADTEHDVVTVITLKDDAALAEFGRIAQKPEILKAFFDDEEKFLDRSKTIVYRCEQLSTPPLERSA